MHELLSPSFSREVTPHAPGPAWSGHASLLRQTADRELPGWAADIDVASWGQYLLSHPPEDGGVLGPQAL